MRKSILWLAVILLLITASGIAVVHYGPSSDTAGLAPPVSLVVDLLPQESNVDRITPRQRFYQTEVEPALSQTDKRNREAAERCLKRLEETINGYRAGIPGFAKDINSWGARLGVLRRMPRDWLLDTHAASGLVERKFHKHFFADQSLQAELEASLAQFREEVLANQNAFVIRIQAGINTHDLTDVLAIDLQDLTQEVQQRVSDYSQRAADQTVVNLLLTEIISGVGGYAAQQMMSQLTARLAAIAATSTAAAGGATSGGAVVGGSVGSLGGPIATVAGFAVGVLVGVIIDWAMSSRFEAKVSEQLDRLLNQLRHELLVGTSDQPGLQAGLASVCELLRLAYADALHAALFGGSNP